MAKEIINNGKDINALFRKVTDLIEQARKRVVTAVNVAEVYTKYHIGQYIVEYEQKGESRAEYGKAVLKDLSVRLTERFGNGWSVDILENCRTLYILYSISETVSRKLDKAKNSVTVSRNSDTSENDKHYLSNLEPAFSLSWSHYQILMRIDNPDASSFYEIEATQQQWSVRQLRRQVGSSLYERLA